jgi:hypothetical protein
MSALMFFPPHRPEDVTGLFGNYKFQCCGQVFDGPTRAWATAALGQHFIDVVHDALVEGKTSHVDPYTEDEYVD